MPAKLEAKQIRLRRHDNAEMLQPVRFLTCDNGHCSLLPAHDKYSVFRCPYCFTIYERRGQGLALVRNDDYLGPFRYGDRLEAVPERFRKGHDE